MCLTLVRLAGGHKFASETLITTYEIRRRRNGSNMQSSIELREDSSIVVDKSVKRWSPLLQKRLHF